MENEYEIVSHPRFRYLNVFLVRLLSRTPHIHRDLELGAILEGGMTVRIGRRSWELRKNDLYLINSMEAHEFSSEGEGTLVLAMQISPRLLSPFLPDAEMRRFMVAPPLRAYFSEEPERYGELLSLCAELAERYYTRPAHHELFCYQRLVSILYLLDCRLPVRLLERQDYLPIKRRADRMVEITDFIDRNFQRKLLLNELAEKYGLTLSHLSHLFKDTLGVSFQEYLKEKRFEYACLQVTTTDKTILDISMESGFSDARYLIGIFESKLGCSPREYRKRLKTADRPPGSATESTQRFLTDAAALPIVRAWRDELSTL